MLYWKWAFSDVLKGVTSKIFFWRQAPRPPFFSTMAMERMFSVCDLINHQRFATCKELPTLNWTSTSTFIVQLSKGLHLQEKSGIDHVRPIKTWDLWMWLLNWKVSHPYFIWSAFIFQRRCKCTQGWKYPILKTQSTDMLYTRGRKPFWMRESCERLICKMGFHESHISSHWCHMGLKKSSDSTLTWLIGLRDNWRRHQW